MNSSKIQDPLISIITINFNHLEVTLEFLESLKYLNYSNYEVIVVDNNSEVNPLPVINGSYPNVKVLLNQENLGFAGGNNSGIKVANGKYILLINNDTEITENLLEGLINPFFKNKKVGIVCPKIIFYHSPDTIQYAGFNSMHPITGRTSAIGNLEKDKGQYDYLSETHAAHGCAMMVCRNVIDKVGLMPDIYFLYYEEWDWSASIKNAGYKIMYQGNVHVLHKESVSTGKNSPLKTYYHTRNRVLFMRRNSKKLQLLLFYLFFLFIILPKNTIFFLAKKDVNHLKCFWEAIWWNFINKKNLVYENRNRSTKAI